MTSATIVFPHQLFENNPALDDGADVFLVEEFLFFRQYSFHKQKLRFHRASMKAYEAFLHGRGFKVSYIESSDKLADVRLLIPDLENRGFTELRVCEVADDWLSRRMRGSAKKSKLVEFESPAFLNTRQEVAEYFGKRKRYFQTDFYTGQRKRLGILLNPDLTPVGGKWSFDAENRKRYPKGKVPPEVRFPDACGFDVEACDYVMKGFAANPGEMPDDFRYPVTHASARNWLADFLETRFAEFGGFEDSIVAGEKILHHSLLSPLINAGLLTPGEVVGQAVEHASANGVPINSVEGFVRQVIGWREFIRGVYETAGAMERTRNFWGFDRKIPPSFWNGTTGIVPVDSVIRKVLETGYCHHIERLMVLGNFMLLCEFDPDEVYRWFMEMFIDAYDWVMVPNVYGMSQFADGGLFATKPYLSGSNYLMKMGDYPKGDWQAVWDSLFWRFMAVHRDFFSSNPRLSMLLGTFDRMPAEKRSTLIKTADDFLESL